MGWCALVVDGAQPHSHAIVLNLMHAYECAGNWQVCEWRLQEYAIWSASPRPSAPVSSVLWDIGPVPVVQSAFYCGMELLRRSPDVCVGSVPNAALLRVLEKVQPPLHFCAALYGRTGWQLCM
jgi:hypothetical protein